MPLLSSLDRLTDDLDRADLLLRLTITDPAWHVPWLGHDRADRADVAKPGVPSASADAADRQAVVCASQ